MTALSDAARDARRAYYRRWREQNPDKVKQYETRRWEKLAQSMKKEGDTNGEADPVQIRRKVQS